MRTKLDEKCNKLLFSDSSGPKRLFKNLFWSKSYQLGYDKKPQIPTTVILTIFQLKQAHGARSLN